MTKDLDEDLIEATIRRVAEAKAAREGGADPALEPEAAPEPAESAAPAPEATAASSDSVAADEDLIAATIRRVAEAKASQSSPEREPEPERDATPAVRAEAPDVPPRRIQRPAPPLHSIGSPRRDEAGGESWEHAVAELRRELDAARRELAALSARFDAALPQLNGQHQAPVVPNESEDDWDEAPPQLPRISPGLPPRPAILRDPSPHTATAEHLEPVPDETVIDTRPIPKPLPPLHAEPKRGLDLLPRTYRITVEDKRRGVDLVPLHRALLGMDGVRDMSLLSYSNGVAIVAVDMIDELEPQTLEGAITRAMSRGAKVEVHNDTTMVVKLAEE